MLDSNSNAIEWISGQVPTFGMLPAAEQKAVADFALVWSYFESQICHCDATIPKLVRAVDGWKSNGVLSNTEFDDDFAHFQDRYTTNGTTTPSFHSFKFRHNDHKQFVEEVLLSDRPSCDDKAKALLIIVYRLRNNLFHGEKWAFGIADQFDNFTHAISILTNAIGIPSRRPARK